MKRVIAVVFFGVTFLALAEAKEWYETAAFYQIYPQTFYDSNKGTPGFGDLNGIKEKLDYLKDLGIDALWLTPIFQSSFNAFGYDITDYKDIDPRYGTKDDFVDLIKAVHEKGMKIIVDFVPNHCGIEHPFFKKSIEKDETYDNWFVWTSVVGDEELGRPSNWQRIGGLPGSAWNKISARPDEWYYAQFYYNMPDFNLREEAVRKYFLEVMEFWLDLDLDGFRVDAISHGFEALPGSDGKYKNEDINESVKNQEDFGYLNHTLTQDQPELFDLIYDWRSFLNEYQTKKNSTAK